MALTVTSTAAGDITAHVLVDTLRIVQLASRRTAICDFVYKGTTTLVPEDEITVNDGATRVFRGKIRNRKRGDSGPGPARAKRQLITCQDVTTYLADDVIDGTLVITAGTSDQAAIDSIVAYSTKGITSPHAQNQVVVASLGADIDVSNLNLYDAIASVTKVTGAKFYVDDDLKVHNYTTESNPAPFALVDNAPNGTTRIAFVNAVLPDETFELVNAVWMVGGDGTTPRWRPPTGSWPTASHTTYGRRERSVILPDVTDNDELDARGDALIAAYASALSPVGLTIYTPGILAGMTATLEYSLWSINTGYPVTEVITTVMPGTKDKLQYDITLGSQPSDLGTMIQDAASQTALVMQAVADLPMPGADTTAPAVPSGLVLTTGAQQNTDGSSDPWLNAAWNAVGDTDLEAYELEVDRAIAGDVTFAVSASGTGGSLAPGTYQVRITGLGQVAGESLTEDVISQAVTSGQRLFVNITAKPGITTYKVYASTHADPKSNGQTTTTTGSNVEITSAGAGAVAPTASTAVSFLTPKPFRTNLLQVRTEDVAGGVYYAGRVRAIDKSGNRSAFSSVSGVTVAPDSTAPAIPGGLDATPGFRMVGVRWARNLESDLSHYELRYAPDTTTDWVTVTTRGNLVIVDELLPPTLYDFQVRAVDWSGNVRTSAGDPTAVRAEDNPEAGWADVVSAAPTLVGAADVSFNSVLTNILATNALDATTITTGTLSIGGNPNTPDFLLVYNASGDLIGRWDQFGLVVIDPTNSSRAMRFQNGVLQFTGAYVGTSTPDNAWTTAISADGIIADTIKLGTAPGGHNAVPNAGFELANFTTLLGKVWTLTTDWDDALSQVFVDVSGSSLTLISAAY